MREEFRVMLMPGEGIGPEIVAEGEKVLREVIRIFDLKVELSHHLVGRAQHALSGRHLSPETEGMCDALSTDRRAAILFGAVTGEPIGILRKRYDLFANLRPVRALEQLLESSPLRPERLRGTDLMIVRELVSDVYYGPCERGHDARGAWASQLMYYHEEEIRRVAKIALQLADARRRLVHLVHKVNVIEDIFELWIRVLNEEATHYPEVEIQEILVDNMAMQLVLNPRRFDVILCSNMFGDILSDLAAGLIGSIGMLPSASLNAYGFGLFESIGGTAPDIAGKQVANPMSTILCVAMICRHTFGHEAAAKAIENAVERVLIHHRTRDLYQENCSLVSTAELGTRVVASLRA